MLEILLGSSIPRLRELSPSGSSTVRAFSKAVSLNNDIIALYGGWNGTANTNIMTLYNTRTNSITERNITGGDTRHSYGIVAHADRENFSIVYAAGPANRNSFLTLNRNSTSTTIVSLANSGTPTRQEPILESIGNTAYLFGGWDPNDVILGDFYSWTIGSTTMQKITHSVMPPKRRAAMSCVANGKLYLTGGRDAVNTNEFNSHKDLWCYDPITNTWTQLADAPVSSVVGGMAFHKGYIYVYGGLNDSVANSPQHKGLYKYDLASNTWQTLLLSGGVNMHGHALVSNGTDLFVMFGSTDGVIGKRIFKFDNL